MQSSAQVRDRLVSALELDLVGPGPGDGPHAAEILPMAPAVWYLTGFLAPFDAPAHHREGDDADGELDAPARPGGDDDSTPEATAARKGLFPSSIGLSMLVPPGATRLEVEVTWGDYAPVPREGEEGAGTRVVRAGRWKRTPHEATVAVALGTAYSAHPVPGGGGLELVVRVRPVGHGAAVPPGTRAVSVFLVNRRPPADGPREQAWAFQAALRVRSDVPLVGRGDRRSTEEWDDLVADLQHRDALEHAVGHNVSARAICGPDGACREVLTCWIPRAEVERVEPGAVECVLGMEALAALPSGQAVADALRPLVERYGEWLTGQARHTYDHPTHAETAAELLARAETARGRIAAGLDTLARDDRAHLAFQIANRAIATALRQRACHNSTKKPGDVPAPAWRPFQLAFLLLNIAGLTDATHPDRQVVDLLFFPTGGGKTEAYLGLAAFSLALRRLRNPGVLGAGVGVLMRYTLRLLTLDQFGRAAAMICALELERQKNPGQLGTWPFEIGLWVGMSATPNNMGEKGDSRPTTARARTLKYQDNDKRHPSPIPLEECPWCGTKFTSRSFKLEPSVDRPQNLAIRCVGRDCVFSRNSTLPILAVDEPIYRRLPSFLIATVDKLAGLPYVGPAGALFGHAERADNHGFYGPSEPGKGRPLERPLLPPELIIQDELHLISGPLGTMVGLYEAALAAICTRDGAPPAKLIASTATVRRAEKQIRALFGRAAVDIFPPPGPDRRDSFFARTVPSSVLPARLYLGVAGQGRSLKVALLRTYLALLGAAQRQYDESGGQRNTNNPADPYMTLLGYFNSLRELGGSRRIVEDEVNARLTYYGERKRDGDPGSFANRAIDHLPHELTSRVSTNQVADTKRRLAVPFGERERVDVALATNMISVGLDITRLGLMVVLGQPKAAAEYIQATSRVGRRADKPGLVITLLNVHRPRDRSHYERFAAWHASFYRAVEATSVTPFAARARQRGLAGVTVALARHAAAGFAPPRGAVAASTRRDRLNFVAEALSRSAEHHDRDLSPVEQESLRQTVRKEVAELLDDWAKIAHEKDRVGAPMQYAREAGEGEPLLHTPEDPALKKLPALHRRFTAARSLRDVEPSVDLWVRTPDGSLVSTDEEEAAR